MEKKEIKEKLKERTLRNLMDIYVSAYVKVGIGFEERFMQQAEDEGFTFPSGLKQQRKKRVI